MIYIHNDLVYAQNTLSRFKTNQAAITSLVNIILMVINALTINTFSQENS